jgi:DTW domain-containing protein
VRPVCLRCRRPEATCYCARLPRLETRTRVVFLQHPRERRVAIGTARMAHLSLPNSELHLGVDFTGHQRLETLAANPGRVAVLFPGQGAMTLEEAIEHPPETLIVVDGTWPLAKKVVKSNPLLASLPRIGFTPRRPSNYRIRAEPAEHCVSTIEAVVEILSALEGGDPGRFDAMLQPFEFMVDTQLESQSQRNGPARRRVFKSPWRPPLELRSLADDFPRLVLVYAEANAHPVEEGIPPELVHLVACRPATGERFEALVAPRQPLARSTPLHTELPEESLRAGEDRDAAMARFEAFLHPDDMLAVWTTYALDLLWRDGVTRRPAANIRLATARALKGKAGGVDQAVPLLGAELPTAWAPGRAGRRIQALEAVVRELVRRGQAQVPETPVRVVRGTPTDSKSGA